MADQTYEGLSTEEVRLLQNLSKWSSARVATVHQSMLHLVDRVRASLERTVEKHKEDEEWIPDMGWTMAYRVTVDGGAKLISEYYKREAKNPAMGLTDEQLEIELQKAAVALLDTVPLEDVERVLRRRKYIEARGEERPPKGERFAQNARMLKETK